MAETGQPAPPTLSLVIPVRNGSATIGRCLEAAVRSVAAGDEIIVVDDGSSDGSAGIARSYACRLIRLGAGAGAAWARNVGALNSRCDALLFIDADCLVREDTIALVRSALSAAGPGAVVGGTYTPAPFDRDFFSRFQSVFINHSELRRPSDPDYVASHAMAMHRTTFLASGGFPRNFLPIIEDVEFSHRLRTSGCRLVMHPKVQVTHIFRFSLGRSLRNAARKARYWTRYSLIHRDLLADSGTASRELKANVLSWAVSLAAACSAAAFAVPPLFAAIPPVMGANAIANRKLFRAWWTTGGPGFGIAAAAYYVLIYPAAVTLGGVIGLAEHLAGAGRNKVHFAGTRHEEAS